MQDSVQPYAPHAGTIVGDSPSGREHCREVGELEKALGTRNVGSGQSARGRRKRSAHRLRASRPDVFDRERFCNVLDAVLERVVSESYAVDCRTTARSSAVRSSSSASARRDSLACNEWASGGREGRQTLELCRLGALPERRGAGDPVGGLPERKRRREAANQG